MDVVVMILWYGRRLMRTRLAAVVVLALVSVAGGQMPDVGVAVKGGGHWADDPRQDERNVEPSWEVELEGPWWYSGHIAMIVSVGGTKYDSERPAGMSWTVGSVDYTERYKGEYSLFGGKLGVRVRPWPEADFQPYFMGGLGYYQYEEDFWTQTTSTWWDATEGEYVSETGESTHTNRVDKGFYPWVGAGFDMPIGGYSSLTGQTRFLVEVQHEFSKRYHDADLGGWILLAGLRFRF
jgi:hypothetical protein